ARPDLSSQELALMPWTAGSYRHGCRGLLSIDPARRETAPRAHVQTARRLMEHYRCAPRRVRRL
ncbi:MAG: hypothetical protein WBH94_01320, partial [Methanoculleus sp.]